MVSTTAAALLSTGAISLAPNLLLLLFPSYATGEGEGSKVLSLGQAMAAGGLLGDVFLHTLPHAAADASSTSHSSEAGGDAGLWVMVGFTAFLASDLLIRSLEDARTPKKNTAAANSSSDDDKNTNNNNHTAAAHSHSHSSGDHSRASFVILNLAADALHNFTDGLAIGATYAVQKEVVIPTLGSFALSRGGLTSLSILLHEVPHELGDFCSLIRSGYSKRQAILAQFCTAIAAFIGTIVALTYAEGWAGHRLLFVTAGGFVYLAATTILPEVLDDRCSFPYRIAQLAAFCTGIAFLYAVALLEENDPDHSHHEHNHQHHHHESSTDHHDHGPHDSEL